MIWPEKKHLRRMGGLTACMKLATEDALYVRQIRDALGGTNREAFESEAATVQSAMVHLAKCMASVPLSRFHGKSIYGASHCSHIQHCGIPTPALLDPSNPTNRLPCGAEPTVVTAKTQ